MKDLRLELRARNNVLWHAIFDRYPSVDAFCRSNGLPYSACAVGRLLNLRRSPFKLNRPGGTTVPTRLAQRLADLCQTTVEDLFPVALYRAVVSPRVTLELDASAFVSLAAVRTLAIAPNQEDDLVQEEVAQVVAQVLHVLTPRQERVLTRRFGLGGSEPMTLEAVGELEGVTKEQIRQIEAKALSRLRHPARAKGLRGLVSGVGIEP